MELSKDLKITEMRVEMLNRIDAAAAAAYSYWTKCDVGDERTWGANVYTLLQRTTRMARDDL